MTNKKLGILILCPFFRPNVGGVETHLDDLCEYLRTHNYGVFVLTYQPVTTKARGASLEKKEGLEIHRYNWPGFNLFHKLEPYPALEFLYLTPYLFLRTFIFLARHSFIDVIHAQGFNSALIAKILGKIFQKRVVVSTHAVYQMQKDSLFAKMTKWALSDADKILTLAHRSKKELEAIGVPGEKIEVYTYWVNQEIFRPQDKNEARQKLGWENKFVVFFVGRLIEKKGMRLLLEIAKETKLPIFFAIAGDGPMAQEIQKEAGNNPKIIFVGKIQNQNLPIYYNAADLLIIPSQYEEGFGRVILEALSCGLPVLGSNLGGIPEAVDSSVAILTEPTKENFQKEIEKMYNQRQPLSSMAKNCRTYAEKHFSKKNGELIERSYTK